MIGVFDSGHGGLTVLRALAERLPRQPFAYLGDHANAPYGQRRPEEILDLTRQGVEVLFAAGCRLVLLACNTAASVALRRLQQEWLPARHPDRRILGVLVPMVEAVARSPWHAGARLAGGAEPQETVGVFATSATVASGAYVREVARLAPAVRVVQEACPELAGLIERDAPDEIVARLVSWHAGNLRERLGGGLPDSVVLGCTHYPLVEAHFRAAFPDPVRILSQPVRVAESLTAYLWRHPEFRTQAPEPAPIRFFTSGDPEAVDRLARRFYGPGARFERPPVRA